jgi:hypothetical protein
VSSHAYLCVRTIIFASSCNFLIGFLELFRQCGILELFRQCGILELFRQCGILELFRQFGILELFRQCGILELFRQRGILELFRQCGILELFRQCGIFYFHFYYHFYVPIKLSYLYPSVTYRVLYQTNLSSYNLHIKSGTILFKSFF